MQKATTGKRILAFILDSLFYGIISSFIVSFLDDPAYLEQMLELETLYMNGAISFDQYYDSLLALEDPNLAIKALVELVLIIVYFIVVPIFWKNQTLGRTITKIKVVQQDFQPAKPVNFILREGFGQLVFSSIITVIALFINNNLISTIDEVVTIVFSFMLIIGFFTMLGSSKTTLYDRISKTYMVLKEEVVQNDFLDVKETNVTNDDIIDL